MIDDNFGYVKKFQLYANSKEDEYKKVLKQVNNAGLVLISAFVNVRDNQGTVDINQNHLALINDILKMSKPTIIMSFGNPYILHGFPNAGTYLCAYGGPEVSQNAMMKAVLGEVDITGKLPVTIPDTDCEFGSGIQMASKGLFFPAEAVDTNYDFSEVDSLMNDAVKNLYFPGGVLLVGYKGKVILQKPYGNFTYDKKSSEMEVNTIFDLASVSKVLGTTTAAMMLYDEGKLKLNKRVCDYIPDFGNSGKEDITIKNLLLHNAGFPAWKPYYKMFKNRAEIINDILTTDLENEPGEVSKYSDLSMITLQLVIEKISGKSLDVFLNERLFSTLGLERTMYNPPAKLWGYCAPTEKDEYWRMTTLQGKVHDETAYLMGGVAGHAGLFASAQDAAKIMFMLINSGKVGSKEFIKSSTVKEWTSKQDKASSRGFGWDTKSNSGFSSAGDKFSENSFGHTGYTGTSVWADKEKNLFVILFTNRVYPNRSNTKIIKFRPVLHNAVAEAVKYKL